jgi:hypothetical protein
MSSSPFRVSRGDGPDGPSGKPGGHGFGEPNPAGNLASGVEDQAAEAFDTQRPTAGDDRPADSYVPGSYTYPTPHEGSRLGF